MRSRSKTELPPREALRPNEVAKALGISRASLFSLWACGEGPPRMVIGRAVLVPLSDLRQWMSERVALSARDESRSRAADAVRVEEGNA